jgi:taurine dioxygenase
MTIEGMVPANGDIDLSWRPLAPFGVEIDHDLSAPLSAAQERQFVDLLWAHGLILARGQALSMARQQQLCALAGPILIRPGEDGYLSTEGGSEVALTELSWHADAAYTDAPFDALALYAIDVVDEASSTFFTSAEQGWATLPATLRDRMEGRRIEMISPSFETLAGRCCDRPDPVAHKRSEQPAIQINPHNGRPCLWTSELQTARITGMDWAASRDLLHALFDHLYRDEHVLEHRWRRGDLVIWDNIALQHRRGSLKGCGRRILQRVIVGTAGVAPHLAQAAALAS